ncbi:antitoxin component YwqK of YwqJK toxin-antitoxin module [Mucilaginibacter frigoritolerans]|uniref:Antitoxin component YwqK of YwqJK toxin-antitoxin module n=1 Tax=Mucilaginibacter frigoritolerans TaxID=652788 RepID=A0A562U197_9SPHI|nr:toxin-antitoxin system YwqK family antitoxin [Mucilaginibacter frigoritolerans]TWI99278.1 antitoxin component YwqK of YwqJK toxin-antitoxin module [Mucilaginibacter frigoritolerans]
MKYLFLFFLGILLFPRITSAQKIELINSGDIIKQGVALYDSGQYKKALVLYNKICRSDTNYVESLYEKAMTCEADSQYTQAIKYCKEGLALKEQPENEPDFYNVYGNVLNDIKQNDEALKIFDKAIAKYPAYSLSYFNKAITLMSLNKLQDAEQVLQLTLLINPYMYSAHYQLGVVALKQGKIIPAFISFVGYLLVNPEGKYSGKAIAFLSKISKSTDDIMELKNSRAIAPDANYQQMEDIVISKIAFDKGYKPIIVLDDQISRQMQVIVEKLEYSDSNNDFWIQYYLPYFKQVYKDGQFELFVNHCFSNVNLPVIKDYIKKNKKASDAFISQAADYFNLIRSTRELQSDKRTLITDRYLFEDGKLTGKGIIANNGKILTGPWKLFYSKGNIRGFGSFDENGQRQGDWSFYYFNGQLKSKVHYQNGKLQGEQLYYQQNGNLSSIENDVNDKLDGISTTYFYSGNKRAIINYKQDKKDGEEHDYYSNGNLRAIYNYTNDVLTGTNKEYYKTGPLKSVQEYVNGKSDGAYKSYYESGNPSTEGVYSKDKAIGEWKYYYDNGKPKEKRTYNNDNEEGPHQEFYDNGQLELEYNAKKDKINGEETYYNKEGKVYAKYIYDNGVVKSAKYFNPAGAQISSAGGSSNVTDIITYTSKGIKKAHFGYDKKGNADGPDTIFYPSGKIYQVNNYKNGKLNGASVTYYRNGKKKSEVPMVDDKEDGYYSSYYTNGQMEAEGWLKDDENEGLWITYNELGNISIKAYYQGGELNGYKEEYTPNGKKSIEQKYHLGWLEQMTQYDTTGNVLAVDSFPKTSGKYTLLYPTGKIKALGNYVNGDLVGPYKNFYFDGSLQSTLFYKNGMLDSNYVSYYYGGKKYAEGKYLHNNKTGVWKLYNEDDGSLYNTVNYVNDQINGTKNYFLPNGSKDFTSTYKDDELNGLHIKYDPDGTQAYQVLFEDDAPQAYTYTGPDGKLVPFIPIDPANGSVKAYFQNGKIAREVSYRDGAKNGLNKIYYGTGQLRSTENMAFDILEGSSKEYYPNGAIKYDYNYLTDNVTGIGREYYPNGKLKKEATFLNGLSNGPTKYFDENGKLIKTLYYYYDNLIAVTNEK